MPGSSTRIFPFMQIQRFYKSRHHINIPYPDWSINTALILLWIESFSILAFSICPALSSCSFGCGSRNRRCATMSSAAYAIRFFFTRFRDTPAYCLPFQLRDHIPWVLTTLLSPTITEYDVSITVFFAKQKFDPILIILMFRDFS